MRRHETPGLKHHAVSPLVEAKLVDTLFDQYGSIVVGQLGVIAAAALAYFHNGSPWLLVWVFVLVVILPFRLWLAWAYWRRAPSDAAMPWVHRFAILAGLTSLSYGVASAAAVLHSDQFLQMVTITAQCAYVTIAAVRNNAVPKVAALQGITPPALLSIACLATGKPAYMAYSVLVMSHLVCVIQIIRFLSQKTRDLLVAEERATVANTLLAELATTDSLTGTANRRGFDDAMSRAIAHAVRHREDLSLLLLDIDHFKALNDTYGHQVGDECLRAVAARLHDTARTSDVVSRHGGEEFAVLLPSTGYKGAAGVADRVRIAIKALEIAHPTSSSGTLTVSVGYATIGRGNNLVDGDTLIKQADRALYRAKDTGRDRIAGWSENDEPNPAPSKRSNTTLPGSELVAAGA